MKGIYSSIKYRDAKQFIKILIIFVMIFSLGILTLYSQEQWEFIAGDFWINDSEIIFYMGRAEHIIIPDNLEIKIIGDNSFRALWSLPNIELKSIIIPKGVTSIGYSAFEECFNLTSITLPEGLVSIGNYAFSNCRSLQNIVIPESVIDIGRCTFSLCSSLESITIPANVISHIDHYMFYGCTSLTNITVDERNLLYSSSDGILFNKDKTTLIRYPAGKMEQTYIIPSSVTVISPMAFADSRLTNIIIHENVNSIGDDAFYRCSQLVNITVDEQNRAFSSDDGVLFNEDKTLLIKYPASKNGQTYIIPSSVTVIGKGAFYGSLNLEYMTIPPSITSIKERAFVGGIKLKTIVLPRNLSVNTSRYQNNIFGNTIEFIYYD